MGFGAALAMVAKVNAAGTALIYLKGPGYSGQRGLVGQAVAADAQGNVYLTGSGQNGIDITPNAFQITNKAWTTCFVTKLNPTGTPVQHFLRWE